MSDQQDDMEKTTKMDETPASPEKKKKGDWITMPMQAAKPSEAPKTGGASQPASAPQAPAPSAAPQVSAPAAAPASTPAAPVSSGGMGSFLSNFGINDPNTQRWVLIGGGAFVFLCCACLCAVIAGPALLSNFN